MPNPPNVINQGDLYWCEPDPKDTCGSEIEKDRPWLVVSIPRLNRGNCVVGLPLSSNMKKAMAHLIAVPKQEITLEDGKASIDCVALTDQIRALDKTRFRKKAGHVSRRALTSVLLGLDYLFGNAPLPPPPPDPNSN
jgi:mRNA-degrading endonuclease toxin of MazEF toxin-antitoxin module